MAAFSDRDSVQNFEPRGIIGFWFSRRSLARCFQERASDFFIPKRSAPPPLPNPTFKWQFRAQLNNDAGWLIEHHGPRSNNEAINTCLSRTL